MSSKTNQIKHFSMTGFASGSEIYNLSEYGEVTIFVEIKTLNSRFLDLSYKLPLEYSQLEPELRKICNKYFVRGRVSVTIRKELVTSENTFPINKLAISSFINNANKLAKELNCSSSEFREELLCQVLTNEKFYINNPEAFTVVSKQETEIVIKLVEKTILECLQFRQIEGESLVQVIIGYVNELNLVRLNILEIEPKSPERYKQKVTELLVPLVQNINLDQSRLATEIAILAEKRDISEELERINAHIVGVKQLLTEAQQPGRKLEFYCQELNREFNTVGSKSDQASVQTLALDAKVLIEKIREQAANIE